ncbi:hypothetical protein D3C74_258980 [compost metagenome]
MVFAVFVELGRSDVHTQEYVFTWRVAGFRDSFHNRGQSVFVGSEVWCKTAFVANSRVQAFCFKYGFQVVENLCACAKSFFEGRSAYRQDHEFLYVYVVVGMRAAVHDVHHRNRKLFRVKSAQVSIQRQVQSVCSCASNRHRNGQDRVSAQFAFVRRAVQFDHHFVDANLVQRVHANHFRSDGFVHVLHGVQYAFAQVTGFVVVAKLYSFMRAGGSTGRNDGTAHCAGFEINFNFNGRVAAGVKDFASVYVRNNRH